MEKKPIYEVVAEFHHPPMPIGPIADDEVVGIIRVEETRWQFEADNNDEAVSQAQKKLRGLVDKFLTMLIENREGDEPTLEDREEVFGNVMQHCVKIKKVRQIVGKGNSGNKKTNLVEWVLFALGGILTLLILCFLISRIFI
jgi:hypothetical protein